MQNDLRQFKNTTVYTSGFIRIINYECGCNVPFTSKTEQSGYFCIGFIRTGNFHFKSFRQSSDLYNSRILIEKPECEYRLTHSGDNYNATTFYIFSESFYESLKEKYRYNQQGFLNNKNILSLLITTTPELDLIHFTIWKKIRQSHVCNLEIDSLVVELIELVSQILTFNTKPLAKVDGCTNKIHLATIERAKEYLFKNFSKNISLNELAQYCYVSPYHFSRTFKHLSAFSPYRYLQDLRLKNAEMLLKTTELSITDVCYHSGFNSPDYFSAAFTKKFKIPPTQLRQKVVNKFNSKISKVIKKHSFYF